MLQITFPKKPIDFAILLYNGSGWFKQIGRSNLSLGLHSIDRQ